MPVLCLLPTSEHVEFLLLQRRGGHAASHHRAKPRSDAEGDVLGWRHEVPPSLFPFRRSSSAPWYARTVGDALCQDVGTMNESSQKYLDKAAPKTRALVPNEPALGECVPGGVYFHADNVCAQIQLL